VNVHRLVKILIQPAGVSPSIESQRKLVKWLVFCARWPDLVDDVIEYARYERKSADAISGMTGHGQLPARESTDLTAFAVAPKREDGSTDAGDLLSSEDLLKREWLQRAAEISQLTYVEPARQQSAT